MDSVYKPYTENVKAPRRCTVMNVSRSVKPTNPFLTLASNNKKALSLFISEVKNACSEFVTDVCELVGDEEDYSDGDSDYDDSDYSDGDSEVNSDSELTRKIVDNEFESIIIVLKNMVDSLEQKYLATKDAFYYRGSKAIGNFTTSYTNGTMGM